MSDRYGHEDWTDPKTGSRYRIVVAWNTNAKRAHVSVAAASDNADISPAVLRRVPLRDITERIADKVFRTT
jgi:hypothetical protein